MNDSLTIHYMKSDLTYADNTLLQKYSSSKVLMGYGSLS